MKLKSNTIKIPHGEFTFADFREINPNITTLTLRKFIMQTIEHDNLTRKLYISVSRSERNRAQWRYGEANEENLEVV